MAKHVPAIAIRRSAAHHRSGTTGTRPAMTRRTVFPGMTSCPLTADPGLVLSRIEMKECFMDESVDILCEKQGEAGIITLNRPRALNALNLTMVREMRRALDAWARDPAVTRIVVQGAGEKAFCAGGDIRQLTDDLRAGKRDEALAFWREEYQLY